MGSSALYYSVSGSSFTGSVGRVGGIPIAPVSTFFDSTHFQPGFILSLANHGTGRTDNAR